MPTTTLLEPGTDATFDLSFWAVNVAGTSTVTSDSAHSYTGTRSMKCLTDGTNDAAASSQACCQDAGTRISFRVLTSALPPSGTNFFVLDDSVGDAILSLALDNNGHIGIFPAGVTGSTGTTVLSALAWYRLTFSYTITSATVWTFKLFIDSKLELTMTSTGTLSFTGSNFFILACDAGWGANNFNCFDDIYADNGSTLDDPGNIRVIAKRPFANGTSVGFTTEIGSGGSGYGSGHTPQVNERPLSTTNGWSGVKSTTEEYNVEGRTVGDANISTAAKIIDFMGWVYAKCTTSVSDNMQLNGSSHAISLTSTTKLFLAFAASTSYPAGTGTDIGIIAGSTTGTRSLYECGIVIAYIDAPFPPWPPGPPTGSAPNTLIRM